MLGKRHFRVLEIVDEPRSRQALVDSLSYADATITNVLGDLEDLGLIERQRTGTRTTVRPTVASCVETYHSLVQTHPHVDFPDLLSGSTLVLLYHLPGDLTPGPELVERTGLSKGTVYRHLKRLQNRAIVQKDESRYRLADDFVDLHTFAVELYHQLHRQQIKEDIDGGTLIWETHDEFLVQTDEDVEGDGYHLTGLAAFAEYDLMFFVTSSQYYFYSPSRSSLDVIDLVCHLLLIDNDIRNRQYAMLLIAKEEPPTEELLDRAVFYQIEENVEPMTAYLETHGEESAPHLPPWDRFESLAREYDVEV